MKKILITFGFALIFNTSIGCLTSLFGHNMSLWENIVFSQCVGLSIVTISIFLKAQVKSATAKVVVMILSLPISVGVGVTLGAKAIGKGSWSDPGAFHTVLVGLFFGGIGSILFLLTERIENEIKQRQLLKSESEKNAIEAHLKLLQAQVEPHFLFNTLANVSSLIDSKPALAKQLLERLNDWLRVALARARSDSATLGDELDMLENYLEIMKIRFGERLHWRIEVPEDARRSAFPPMLLQPLVENALRHGIEPKLGGGDIDICSHAENSRLTIDVSDSGIGLSTHASASGTGLDNIRARLAALFGDAGRLELQGNARGGTTATLTLPYAEPPP